MPFEPELALVFEAGYEMAKAAKEKAKAEQKPYATVPDRIPTETWAHCLAEFVRPA